MLLLKLFILIATICCCLGAKILVMVPMPAKSHAILFERLVVELGKRNHQVTYMSGFPLKNPPSNVKQIVLPAAKELLASQLKMDMFDLRHLSPFANNVFLPLMGLGLCDALLSLESVKNLVKSNEKFDLIMGEAFLDESMMAGFAYKSKAPMIALGTFMPNIWVNYLVGNPSPPAYIPDPFLGFSTPMTFVERLKNFILAVITETSHNLYYLPKQDAILKKHFGNDLPYLADIIKNTSLVFVNHHHSLAFPRPYVPNMIEIGGIHIEPPKKLPDDLQKFMDQAKEGVVLFSLGSNLQSAGMPPERRDAFVKAFSNLKYKVLWKYEGDKIPGLTANVKLSNWLPQSDLLAHPNLKLFVTHGGLLSTTESIQRGVPVVGIPIFGDQPVNMRSIVNSGFGKSLDFDSFTPKELSDTIEEVIANPKYKQVVKEKSELLKDRPTTPMDTAIYWIEYVIKHKGASHLRSSVQDLWWFQKYLIDVILFVGAVISFVFIAAFLIIKFTFKKLCGKKSKKISSQKKKK